MQLVTFFSGDRAVTHIAEQRTQSHIQYSLAERPQLTQSLTGIVKLSFRERLY